MKVGVIGGTGNISTSIVALLLEKGHDVVCYHRGQTRKPPSEVRVIEGDRRSDRAEFERVMQKEKFGAVVDMICYDAEDARSSTRAFAGVEQFVMCSTVCTYGIEYDWLPVSEDHPLRPISDYGRGKVAADSVFLEAYYGEGFPATIIKPSTTFGPVWNLLRQIGGGAWVDRIRKGKPILVCGDGGAIHQFLDVDDAALCFVGVLEKPHCIGQTYNMMRRGFTKWNQYHRTAMKVIGHEVDMVGVPMVDLVAANVPDVGICRDIFAHNCYYDSDRLYRDVPEFRPQVSLEDSMIRVIEAMDREGRTGNCDEEPWEDQLVGAQRRVREVGSA